MRESLTFVFAALAAVPAAALAAEPAFLMAGSGPVSYMAVVYDDGAVYTEQFTGPFPERPRALPENCGPVGASYTYATLFDFDAFRKGRPAVMLDSSQVITQLERTRQSVWEYDVKTWSVPLTDIGVSCIYAVSSATGQRYAELRLLNYAAPTLTVTAKDRSLREVQSWANDIVWSLPLKGGLGRPEH